MLWANGRLLIAEGSPSDALEVLLQTGEMLGQIGGDQPGMLSWRAEASFAAGLIGEHSRARSFAEEALASARSTRVPRVVAVALRAPARVERGEQSIGSLPQAASLLTPSPPRPERAHVLVELGAAFVGLIVGQTGQPLQEGMSLADAGGARALAALARTELVAAGIHSGRATRERRDRDAHPERATRRSARR